MDSQDFILLERNSPIEWLTALTLVLCLSLVLWAKSIRSNAFAITFGLFRSQLNFDSTIKESWNLLGLPSWLLNFNFILSLGLSLYLSTNGGLLNGFLSNAPLLAYPLAAAFFLLAFLSMTIVGSITGAKKVFQLPMQLAWILPQFVGLLLFAINLIWALNPEMASGLTKMVLILVGILSMQRFSRSARFLIGSKIEWYYILLYLCTLETMPLLLVVWFLFDWTN
jgi:hypothetical protein